jgi:FKBP-type peptidyl-prolyl cis-trans isomerase (trigger factor)
MKVVLQNLPKSTVRLTVTLGVEEIKKSKEKVWDEVVKNAEVDGFRKGNAPVEMVKQKVDPRKVESEIITDLIKTYYPQAVEEQKLSPIIDPKIELDEFSEEKDFTFSVTVATKPTITIGDYKKAIKDVYDKKNEEFKKAKELEPAATETKDAHDHVHLSPNEVTDAIISVTTVEVSDLLVEEEVNKMLSRLVNQVQAVKLDMESYLKSLNKTSDSLKAEFAEIAQKSIVGELALFEVVKKEGVEATDAEVEQTLNAMGDAKLKEQYSKDDYQKAYIKSIIAKNKVIWKLSSPEEEEK